MLDVDGLSGKSTKRKRFRTLPVEGIRLGSRGKPAVNGSCTTFANLQESIVAALMAAIELLGIRKLWASKRNTRILAALDMSKV